MFDKTLARGSMAVATITTALILALSISSVARGQDVLTLTATGAGSVTIPAGYDWINVTVQCWGGGGGGQGGEATPYAGAGCGGGGGAYSANAYTTPLVAGAYSYYVGGGGAGGPGGNAYGGDGGSTIWNYGGAQDIIAGGGYGPGRSGGVVGAGTGYPGGSGGAASTYGSGGGGGSAGPSGPGGQGANGPFTTGGIGYGPGGNGGGGSQNGYNGSFPGGGGGGAGYEGFTGGQGASGEIVVTYTPVYSGNVTWSASGGGSWGTLTTDFGANWGGAAYGSPGLYPSFPAAATLGSSVALGAATVTLGGASPCLATLTFSNSTANYTLAAGSGGTLQLNGGTAAAALTDSAGSHAISAPVALDSSAVVTVTNPGDTLVISGIVSGNGTLTKLGGGTFVLSGGNTYSGVTAINVGTLTVGAAETPGVSGPFGAQVANAANTILFGGGTLQYSTANQFDYSGRFSTAANQPISIDTNGQTVTFATAIQGAGTSLTLNDSLGTGKLILTGSNTYTGGTSVSAGTLQGNTASMQGAIANNAALIFNQTAAGTFTGSIAGSGNLTLTGGGQVALAGADSLGSSGPIAINQGLLAAPLGIPHAGAGITLASAGTLQGSGEIYRAVSGNGTVTAAGQLIIGNATHTGQFNQGGAPGVGGTLNIGSNAVAIFSADTAILGSQTNIGPGGSLTTLNGAQLGNASSLDSTKVLTATGSATINATFVNNGVVNGPTGVGQELTFTQAVKGAGSTTGNVEYAASYSPGNSPAAVEIQNLLLDPTSTLFMEFAGDTPGSAYDQLDISGQARLNGTLQLVLLNGYTPPAGKSFDLFSGPTTGSFSQIELPALGNGLSWNTSNLYTTGEISVTPEPSALVLLAAGALVLLGYGLQRRAARRTVQPERQADAPAILSFPLHASSTSAARRAA